MHVGRSSEVATRHPRAHPAGCATHPLHPTRCDQRETSSSAAQHTCRGYLQHVPRLAPQAVCAPATVVTVSSGFNNQGFWAKSAPRPLRGDPQWTCRSTTVGRRSVCASFVGVRLRAVDAGEPCSSAHPVSSAGFSCCSPVESAPRSNEIVLLPPDDAHLRPDVCSEDFASCLLVRCLPQQCARALSSQHEQVSNEWWWCAKAKKAR